MAIATTMNQDDQTKHERSDDDQHDHDMVMPGFRFHPTEEELVEFYLRRKVEGKRFNVELITFLDLYRYDPWELPALAAIGEKEWFFYVPRDRKYRNGDRPNRVTTSGYWKATGADRMIRTETCRSIGLKKTLVFYSGKAPKGIRTSWIMNEYRLPHHETERLQKAEISLCRVYKRAGVEDHPSLPPSLRTRASSSSSSRQPQPYKKHQNSTRLAMERFQDETEKMSETSGSSTTDVTTTSLGLSNHNPYPALAPIIHPALAPPPPEEVSTLPHQSTSQTYSLVPNCTTTTDATTAIFTGSSFVPPPNPNPNPNPIDDLHRLINYHQQQQQYYQSTQFSGGSSGSSSLQMAFAERLWEWNSFSSDANKDHYISTHFK